MTYRLTCEYFDGTDIDDKGFAVSRKKHYKTIIKVDNEKDACQKAKKEIEYNRRSPNFVRVSSFVRIDQEEKTTPVPFE